MLNSSEYPVVLTPRYDKPSDKVGYHQDRFNNKPEIVCNYYVGSTQFLNRSSLDKLFRTSLYANKVL